MLIDSTVVEKTLQTFAKAGMEAVYTPEKSFADFMVYGDRYLIGEIQCSDWMCYLQATNDGWSVYPPLHFTDRNHMECHLSLFCEAISLTIFLFQRRVTDRSHELRWRIEYTQNLFEEWQRTQQ